MGFEDIRRHFVVFRHGAMYSEENGACSAGSQARRSGPFTRSIRTLDTYATFSMATIITPSQPLRLRVATSLRAASRGISQP